MNWFKRKPKVQEVQLQIRISPEGLGIPKGWMVLELGQSYAHMLWYCQVVNIEDLENKVAKPRRVWREECDSLEEALQACIDGIEKLEANGR